MTRTRDLVFTKDVLYQLSYMGEEMKIENAKLKMSELGSFNFQFYILNSVWWAGLDSNQRSCKAADLQSAPVVHFGTDPYSATKSSSGVHYTPPLQGCQIRNRMAMRFLDILIASRLQWPLERRE